jgi:hypothetical protein
MKCHGCLILLLVFAACVSPLEESSQEARGGGGGTPLYLGFLDELSRPESSIDTNIRAGMPDRRIFWATGNPIPNSITVTSALPSTVTQGEGYLTYVIGHRQFNRPTGYASPLTFDVPRTEIGNTINITAVTTDGKNVLESTQTLTVVDAPTTPTGVTVEKVGTDLVVNWQPSEFGIGPIHYVVENLNCATPRVCVGTTVADTFATTVTFARTASLLRIRAVANNADSNLFEMDVSAF